MAGDNTDIDIGELIKLSPNVFDSLVAGKSGDARPIRQRLRKPEVPKVIKCRQQEVVEYIATHPGATVQSLSEHFLMGDAAAKAYLDRYAA